LISNILGYLSFLVCPIPPFVLLKPKTFIFSKENTLGF